MTDQPMTEKIKAFLDEVVAASVRTGVSVNEIKVDGYHTEVHHPAAMMVKAECHHMFGPGVGETTFGFVDITQLSAHERIKIHAAQSHDLAQMLRDAFMAGAQEADADWFREIPAEFEREADDYAAKIIGGQG